MSDSNPFYSISEDPTEEQADWIRKKMPYDPFENKTLNNKIRNDNNCNTNHHTTLQNKNRIHRNGPLLVP